VPHGHGLHGGTNSTPFAQSHYITLVLQIAPIYAQ
jgi:hypothetical protein